MMFSSLQISAWLRPDSCSRMAWICASFVCRFLLIIVVFMGVVWWLGNPLTNISTDPT